MNSVFLVKERCSGCSACYSVCPKQSITMVQDEEGFSYPHIDTSRCISCGLCTNVCPIINADERKNDKNDQAFILRTRDYTTWKNSSSGGAFTEICKAFSGPNTVIFGAAFDGLTVKHIAINGIKEIDLLRKSKYIASRIDGVFPIVKECLERNNTVVFSGTPCQVAGLKRYLKHDYESLLTIDLICHGVGSPKVFQDCMEIFEQENGSGVSKYTFRAKRLFYEDDYLSRVDFENGKVRWLLRDRYNQLFLSQACTRPSCGDNCVFVERTRESDLTIADFKCLYKDYPQLRADRRNCSSVICHTAKGKRIMKRLAETMTVLECSLNYLVEYNPLYCKHTHKSDKRDSFFREYSSNHKAAIYSWTTPPQKANIGIKMIVSKCVPISWKTQLAGSMKRGT